MTVKAIMFAAAIATTTLVSQADARQPRIDFGGATGFSFGKGNEFGHAFGGSIGPRGVRLESVTQGQIGKVRAAHDRIFKIRR